MQCYFNFSNPLITLLFMPDEYLSPVRSCKKKCQHQYDSISQAYRDGGALSFPFFGEIIMADQADDDTANRQRQNFSFFLMV